MTAGLPPIGAEIPCSMLAIDSVIEYRNQIINCDFRGGVRHRVDVNPHDPMTSVLLRTIGYRVTADTDRGTITFEQNDVDVNPRSTLRTTQQSPPQYLHRDVQEFSVTFDLDGEPVVLVTRAPMVCEATLSQFPPRGDSYRLIEPVDLVDPEHPDTVVARLTAFPSKRGGL
ncbi:hypothetical protein OIB37_19245 [Streptomyces sp. NBC_00820]|uniref:hypothetical protein n=1 Tax=Streptomyces sp. NBC_00820 TaxID=2975842 RepID=UPI002ED0330C|nr:hypothetical protein OIB37_19245 [Streptomyces sp. NBC_00820]